MRAADDPRHMAMLDRMRNPSRNVSRIDMDYLKNIQKLCKEDIQNDKTWITAPITISNNIERTALNRAQAEQFAKMNGLHLYEWKIPLAQSDSTRRNPVQIPLIHENALYENNQVLHGCFVQSAPAVLTTNINPLLGLANGTQVEMTSICLNAKEDQERIKNLLTQPDPETVIKLEHPTEYIAVKIINPTESLKTHPNSNLSTGPDVIIPIYAEMPVKVSVVYRKKFKLQYIPHGLDLAFSITAHKIQGQSCDKLKIDLNKTPFMPSITFPSLYVMLSRVRTSANLRVLPLQQSSMQLNHLQNSYRNRNSSTGSNKHVRRFQSTLIKANLLNFKIKYYLNIIFSVISLHPSIPLILTIFQSS